MQLQISQPVTETVRFRAHNSRLDGLQANLVEAAKKEARGV
jgi:hypothetical protein